MTTPTTPAPDTGPPQEIGEHADEPHSDSVNNLLNRLRASVLGANDGIVSVAGIVMGFAGATDVRHTIFLGGIAGLVAGALSMAAGEYVSVSTQRDTELALIAKETRELAEEPEEELAELAELYHQKGLSPDLAHQVAVQLTEGDPLRAHLDAELGIDPDELTSPWQAAVSSMVAFTIGAVLPLLTILLFGPRRAGDRDCCRRRGGARDHRLHQRPRRRRSHAPGHRAQRGRRPAGDGDHLRHRHADRRRGRLTRSRRPACLSQDSVRRQSQLPAPPAGTVRF